MKKITLIIGIIIAILMAVFVCRKDSFSAEEEAPKTCSASWEAIINSQQNDWNKNLKLLTEQEKPASEMVDEAFESMRTYKCWTEYTCKAVAYSTRYGPEATARTGITSNHLEAMQYFGGPVPTCADPEDLGLESGFATVMENLWSQFDNKDVIPVSYNNLSYIPRCEFKNKDSLNLAKKISDRYQDCKEYAVQQQLNAMSTLEMLIQDTGANQNADAVSNKMSSILLKMPTVEMNMEYVGKSLRQIDTELNCTIKKCT